VGHPLDDRLARGPVADLDAVHRHGARRATTEAGEDLGQLRLAVAGHAGDPQDLAGAHLEGDPPEGREAAIALRPHVLHAQHHRARGERRPLDRLDDLAADHQAGQARRRRVGDRDPGRRDPAPPHDGDPVGDLADLAQLVADEDDGRAAGHHGAQRPEQVRRLLRGQDGRRLVEDEDPGRG